MSIKTLCIERAGPETYVGPDFAILKPWDEFQTEVWTYKENRRIGLYNNHMAERVKEQFDKEAQKQYIKDERKRLRKSQKTGG